MAKPFNAGERIRTPSGIDAFVVSCRKTKFAYMGKPLYSVGVRYLTEGPAVEYWDHTELKRV